VHLAGGMLVNSIKNQMGTERILDVRGLEQPEPLLRALAALDTLGNGEYLRLLSDRDPVLLYPLLDQQGFACKSVDHAAIVELLIWQMSDYTAAQRVRDLFT
jgi:tRNA 2-thiouridine synthesizing protein A